MSRLVALEILRARHTRFVARRRPAPRANTASMRAIGARAAHRRHEVRRRGTLRVLTKTFAHGKPTPGVQDCIALGLIQLLFLDTIPDHAAVSETVRAAGEMLGPKKAQYVNACLRAACARGAPGSPAIRVATCRCATCTSTCRCSAIPRSIRCCGRRKRCRCRCRS
jgi:hypothetical protein